MRQELCWEDKADQSMKCMVKLCSKRPEEDCKEKISIFLMVKESWPMMEADRVMNTLEETVNGKKEQGIRDLQF